MPTNSTKKLEESNINVGISSGHEESAVTFSRFQWIPQ